MKKFLSALWNWQHTIIVTIVFTLYGCFGKVDEAVVAVTATPYQSLILGAYIAYALIAAIVIETRIGGDKERAKKDFDDALAGHTQDVKAKILPTFLEYENKIHDRGYLVLVIHLTVAFAVLGFLGENVGGQHLTNIKLLVQAGLRYLGGC